MIHMFKASVGEPEFEQANIEKYFKLFVYMHLSVLSMYHVVFPHCGFVMCCLKCISAPKYVWK